MPWKVEATNWLPLKLPPWNRQLLNELCMNRLFEKLPLTTVQPSKWVTLAPSEYACTCSNDDVVQVVLEKSAPTAYT